MANSATSPILQQRQPELQVGGVAYRCPIEFRHQVARLEPGTRPPVGDVLSFPAASLSQHGF